MTPEEYTVAQWREAAQDLGFRFVAPFTLEDQGQTLSYLGWLPQFGSDHGMLIVTTDDLDAQNRLLFVADARGFGVSAMSTESNPYDRNGVIEVLNDWGWTSSEPAPAWYKAPFESDAEV
jgi:hypothetical protein